MRLFIVLIIGTAFIVVLLYSMDLVTNGLAVAQLAVFKVTGPPPQIYNQQELSTYISTALYAIPTLIVLVALLYLISAYHEED